MTVGPWKPIALEAYENRITDLDVRIDVSESLDATVTVEIALAEKRTAEGSISLKGPNGSALVGERDEFHDGRMRKEFRFAAGDIELWYPVGYGKQPLYTIEVQVFDNVRTERYPERYSGLIVR